MTQECKEIPGNITVPREYQDYTRIKNSFTSGYKGN